MVNHTLYYYFSYICNMKEKKKKNKKLKRVLKSKGLSVYGLSKALGITPQAGEYIVKEKDLKADYDRLKTIADYCGVTIEEIID